MPPRRFLRGLLLLTVVITGHDRARADTPGALAGSPPAAPSAPVVAAPAGGRYGATRQVAAGETLATISQDCYGSRAYADQLQRVNKLRRARLKAGSSLATPPLPELFGKCAPREICAAIFAAHEAFVTARGLEEAKLQLEAALQAARARGVNKPRKQLEGALQEIAALRSGNDHSGYARDMVHQRLSHALGALSR